LITLPNHMQNPVADGNMHGPYGKSPILSLEVLMFDHQGDMPL
jgi:hypothetical protein